MFRSTGVTDKVVVVRAPAEAGETFDYVVCAHKAIDQSSIPERLAAAVDENKTCIVIIQNGVGNEDPFHEAFPKCPILSCVVSRTSER